MKMMRIFCILNAFNEKDAKIVSVLRAFSKKEGKTVLRLEKRCKNALRLKCIQFKKMQNLKFRFISQLCNFD